MVPFLDNRADFIWEVPVRERLVNIGTRLSVNLFIIFFFLKNGKAGDKCLFPHHKVDEQPNKKRKKERPSPQKEEQATTGMQWLLLEFYLRWVVSRKTRSCWILKEANKPEETRCKKSWDRSEEL